MKLAITIGLVLIAFAGASQAQKALVGKYSGTFRMTTTSGDRSVGLTLDITGAENGKLSGTATRLSFGAFDNCAGTYQVAGKYEGNKVFLRSVSSNRAQDCVLGFTLIADGNKLTGSAGTATIELSKQVDARH